jgi:hypothetical protein
MRTINDSILEHGREALHMRTTNGWISKAVGWLGSKAKNVESYKEFSKY